MTQEKTSTNLVLETVHDLYQQEQLVTRDRVSQITGLSLSIVDDRLKTLCDTGLVVRIQRGVYEPCPTHPPARAISKTILRGGLVKLEIGDEVLTLTPAEDRALATLCAGAAAQFASIEAGRQFSIMNVDLASRIRQLEKRRVNQEGLF